MNIAFSLHFCSITLCMIVIHNNVLNHYSVQTSKTPAPWIMKFPILETLPCSSLLIRYTNLVKIGQVVLQNLWDSGGIKKHVNASQEYILYQIKHILPLKWSILRRLWKSYWLSQQSHPDDVTTVFNKDIGYAPLNLWIILNQYYAKIDLLYSNSNFFLHYNILK